MKIKPICFVTLSIAEFEYAKMIGENRWKRDMDSGAAEKKISVKDSRRINIQGAIGEMAFAEMFDFDMDTNTNPRKGGIDFRCENGITIDVKHTENVTSPKLRNPAYKIGHEYHADVYVLIVGPVSGVAFKFGMIGYAFHGELMKKKNIINKSCTLDGRKLRWDLEGFRRLIGR